MTRTHLAPDADDTNDATKRAKKREPKPNGKDTKQSLTLAAQVRSTPEREADREAKKTAEFHRTLADIGAKIDEAKRKEEERLKAEDERKKKELDAEVERAARLSDDDYEIERKRIAKDFDVRREYLDGRVERARDHKKAGGWSPSEIEPWPEAVDGAAVLDDLAAVIKRHVGVPPHGEDAVALWIMFAHCLDAADISPRLAIRSPTPECGKSTLLRLVGDLVPRKCLASNITAAAAYRTIDMWQPTLLLDEADTFLSGNHGLRGILNSSHSRAEAFVMRSGGANYKPVRFGTWCALAIAMIGQLPPTLASRSIQIELQRLSRSERVQPYRHSKAPYADLARKCARWAEDNIDALRDAEPDMERIANRRADNWRPLFAIADRAGDDWPNRAREAALALDTAGAAKTIGVFLLEDIRTLIQGVDRIPSSVLAEKLGQMEGRPWPEYRGKRPITTHAIARLLKDFSVEPVDMRAPDSGRPVKGYWADALQGVFERYLS
jgi:putative DNA primase/helicase